MRGGAQGDTFGFVYFLREWDGGAGRKIIRSPLLTNVPETEEGLVLMFKKTGKWMGKLYDMALASGYGEAPKVEVGRVEMSGP